MRPNRPNSSICNPTPVTLVVGQLSGLRHSSLPLRSRGMKLAVAVVCAGLALSPADATMPGVVAQRVATLRNWADWFEGAHDAMVDSFGPTKDCIDRWDSFKAERATTCPDNSFDCTGRNDNKYCCDGGGGSDWFDAEEDEDKAIEMVRQLLPPLAI
jgi:hypothetical protein